MCYIVEYKRFDEVIHGFIYDNKEDALGMANLFIQLNFVDEWEIFGGTITSPQGYKYVCRFIEGHPTVVVRAVENCKYYPYPKYARA